MTTERIDVLAVMAEDAKEARCERHKSFGKTYAESSFVESEAARAAVAELVEAGKALLAGSVAQATAADHADMPAEDKADAEFRASVARNALRTALARVGAA